ncbi:MAG: hypothetical protein E2O39_13330 [Planctomycetota bacterium]|nr:MAG: hypothetical protein E2O39_13330 [Planctomycetota bacterium]
MTATRGEPWSRLAILLLLVLGTLASARGLAVTLENRVPLGVLFGARTWLAVLGLAVSVTAGLAAAIMEVRGMRRAAVRAHPFAPLRRSFVVLVGAWLVCLVYVQPFQRLWFDILLGLACGVWAVTVVAEQFIDPLPPRIGRALDLGLFALCLSVVLTEVSLRGLAAVRPSPFFARIADAPRQFLERFRSKPGELFFGLPCNAQGYYDTEFLRRAEGDRLVVAIGDSFNIGSVPHAWHFTTVCERLLDVPVFNMGAAGVAPPEYEVMLVEDALPLDPDIVVVGVFVGNDLSYAVVGSGLPDTALRSWMQRDEVLLFVLPRRLARVAEERDRRAAGPAGVVPGRGDAPRGASVEELRTSLPWLDDPSLEAGSLSDETFLRLEADRALATCRGVPSAFADVCESLTAMRAASGSAELCVMLIPDEFQVEDELWAAVVARVGTTLDRDLPQRRLSSWLAQEGFATLDLLPVLRAVPPMDDGRRHLYHLRDTHFNARGNRVVGEALAEFLRSRLGE